MTIRFECPNCHHGMVIVDDQKPAEKSVRANAQIPLRASFPPAVETCARNLRWFLEDASTVYPMHDFVPGPDLHEQFMDWSTRRGLAPFTQRVTLTAMRRYLGAEKKARSNGTKLYRLPSVLVPLPDSPPEPNNEHWAALVSPDEFPWVRWYKDPVSHRDPDVRADAIAWSASNGWQRPPQMGWPDWRVLTQEEIDRAAGVGDGDV